MNNLKTVILIAGILVAGVAFNSVAQENPEKEQRLTTVYSYKHDKAKHKLSKPHKNHFKHEAKAHKMNKHFVHRHKTYKHKTKAEAKTEE
jgi:hypothetical protein